MKKTMHGRTISIVLATTTLLQLTGLNSKLTTGQFFVKANAEEIKDINEDELQDLNEEKQVLVSITKATPAGAEIEVTTEAQATIKLVSEVPKTVNSVDDLPKIEYELQVITTDAGAKFTIEPEEEWVENNEGTEATFNVDLIDTSFDKDGYTYTIKESCKYEYKVNIIPVISGVKIIRDKDLLIAIFTDEKGNPIKKEIDAEYNWKIGDNLIGNEKNLALKQEYIGKQIQLYVNVEGYEEIFKATYISEVKSIDIFRENNILTASAYDNNGNIIVGNDFELNYKWYIDGEVVSTERQYTLNEDSYNKEIVLELVMSNGDKFTTWGKFTNIENISTKIDGTPIVKNTLEAKVIDDKGNDMSGNFNLQYAWWRMDEKDADSIGVAVEQGKAKLVSEDKTYKITSGDAGKYMRLLVWFQDADGKFRTIMPVNTTSEVLKKSSSGSSSSSSASYDKDEVIEDKNEIIEDKNEVVNNGQNVSVQKEWIKNEDGTWKLTDKNGQTLVGWQLVDGKWYLTNETGTMKTGWQQVNGKWYLLNKDGDMATGWNQVNGKWYFLNDNGDMATGWQQVNGKWYLLNNDGDMATGWNKVNGKWYLLNNNGDMATGWQQVNGKWYLLNDDGDMATGWNKVNGKWYFLNNDGSMASNTTIDGYKLDESGAWVK